MRNVFRFAVICIAAITISSMAASDAAAGVVIFEKDDFSLKIGGRAQLRYQWVEDGKDDGRDVYDFYVRRTRLQFETYYGDTIYGKVEWKVDNIDRYDPSTDKDETEDLKVENAFARFDYFDQMFIVDMGREDGVFSREGRLSDAKDLFTEESTVQDALKEVELADNADGLHITGKLMDRHLEYGVGIYDGLEIEAGDSDDFAYQLALVYHFLDVEESKEGSHIGDGKTYLTAGIYYGVQIDVETATDEFDATAVGADVFSQFGTQAVPGTFTVSGGYFMINEDYREEGDLDGDGYYIEGAYLLPTKVGAGKLQGDLEFALRYGEYDPDDEDMVTASQDKEQLSIGANYYIRKHNVKLQVTYNLNDSNIADNDKDDFQLQAQLAF